MNKFGGFIPGIRPGKPTADYLRYVLSRITLPGSIYLGIIAVLPNLFLEIGNSGGVQNLPFGGTAVLIMVGVGLVVGVLQAATQINDTAVGFLPRAAAAAACLWLAGGWMMERMSGYLAQSIVRMGGR